MPKLSAQLALALASARRRRPLDSSSLVWAPRNARTPSGKRRLVAPQRHETHRRLYNMNDLVSEYQQYQDATAEEEGEYEDEDDGYMGV